MNRIKAFKNAAEFNSIFGFNEHGDGSRSRRNSILLTFYKSKSVWDYCRKHSCFDVFFSIKTMNELKQLLLFIIREQLASYGGEINNLMGWHYYSRIYGTDKYNGIPTDGTVGFVRYVSFEEKRYGKAYKMRAGRFFNKLIMASELAKALPQQVTNWLCEQFAEEWNAYVTSFLPKFTLRVDDRFDKIYSYDHCSSEFNSCMMDDGQWKFYRDSVKAKAAYLVNEKGRIISRCVIFTDVIDEDGKHWRLAERQYSEGCSDLLKRCLVDALIAAGEIDGYKQVGVDCHNNRGFLDVNGNSLHDKKFSIDCDLLFSSTNSDRDKAKHTLSYQDSFKWYDYEGKRAYNYYSSDLAFIELDTTNWYIEDNRKRDKYHGGVLCNSITYVYFNGEETTCDSNHLEDFVYCENSGNWVHKDEVIHCPICGNAMPNPNLYSFGWREFNNQFYCSLHCKGEALDKYRKEHCFKDALDGGCWVNRSDYSPVAFLYLDGWGTREVMYTKLNEVTLRDYFNKRMLTLLDDGTILYTGNARSTESYLRRFIKFNEQNPSSADALLESANATNASVLDVIKSYCERVYDLNGELVLHEE